MFKFFVKKSSILLLWAFALLQGFSYADEMLPSIEYINNLSKIKNEDINSKKQFIQTYCDKLFDDDLKQWMTNNNFLYDPGQSLFVYHLCSHVDEDDDIIEDNFEDIEDFIKEDVTWRDSPFNFVSSLWYCSVDKLFWRYWDWELSNCKLNDVLPEMYGEIINEYSNIKLATFYGYIDEDTETSIKTFSENYYGDYCDDKYYIYPDEINDPAHEFCYKPDTYNYLAEYIEGAEDLVEGLELIDSDSLLEERENVCDEDIEDMNLWKCAYANKDASWTRFQNLMINELMYFNLFVTSYTTYLESDASASWFTPTWDVGELIDVQYQEIRELREEVSKAQQAINKTEEYLKNVYITFPVHISLQAYREDVEMFRDRFAKVYSPIHQFYYRFRNVQEL